MHPRAAVFDPVTGQLSVATLRERMAERDRSITEQYRDASRRYNALRRLCTIYGKLGKFGFAHDRSVARRLRDYGISAREVEEAYHKAAEPSVDHQDPKMSADVPRAMYGLQPTLAAHAPGCFPVHGDPMTMATSMPAPVFVLPFMPHMYANAAPATVIGASGYAPQHPTVQLVQSDSQPPSQDELEAPGFDAPQKRALEEVPMESSPKRSAIEAHATATVHPNTAIHASVTGRPEGTTIPIGDSEPAEQSDGACDTPPLARGFIGQPLMARKASAILRPIPSMPAASTAADPSAAAVPLAPTAAPAPAELPRAVINVDTPNPDIVIDVDARKSDTGAISVSEMERATRLDAEGQETTIRAFSQTPWLHFRAGAMLRFRRYRLASRAPETWEHPLVTMCLGPTKEMGLLVQEYVTLTRNERSLPTRV